MKYSVSPVITAAAFLCSLLLSNSVLSNNAPNIYTVSKAQSNNQISLGGTVIPWKTVKLTAQLPGEVKYIAGSEGDFFTKGTLLASQDSSTLEAKRKAAEAQLDSARAALSNAQVQYQRELVNPNSQSNSMMGGFPAVMGLMTDPIRNASNRGGDRAIDRRASLHQYQVQIETAQNQIRQALAGLKELDENILKTKTYAPFDGKILNKMTETGDIVQPGMPIIVFADTRRLQVQIEVPNRILSNLSVGQQIPARLDNSPSSINVRVARIFPMAEQGAHTTTVKFDLPENSLAHAGMYASVKIPLPNTSQTVQLVIPKSSIVWRGSLPAVFLVKADNHLKMQLIRMGVPIGTDKYAVISGLKTGDRILRSANSRTRSGQLADSPDEVEVKATQEKSAHE